MDEYSKPRHQLTAIKLPNLEEPDYPRIEFQDNYESLGALMKLYEEKFVEKHPR